MKMKGIGKAGVLLALASVVGWESPARSQPLEEDSVLTLEEAVGAAKLANSRLKSLGSMQQAFEQRSAQEGALPNPMFTYRGMNETDPFSFNTDEKRFELEQQFPWFGKRGLRGKVAAKDAEAMGFEYEAMMREVVAMVKETYFELYAVQRALSITHAEESLLKQMEAVALSRYSVGEVTQQDVLKAQSEISMLKIRWYELERQVVSLQAALNQLMNRRVDLPLGVAVTEPALEFEFKVEELTALAEEVRPEVAQARVQIERDEFRRDLMSKEYWPDYRLGLEYRSLRNSPDMLMFSIGFDVPLWRSKYKAGAREAERMVESGQAALEAARRQVAFDVQSAHFKWIAALRTVDLYRTALIPQAEARMAASEAGYRTGQVGFLELLESERFLLDARVMAAMADGELGASLARLERAVGTDLNPGATETAVPPPGQDE